MPDFLTDSTGRYADPQENLPVEAEPVSIAPLNAESKKLLGKIIQENDSKELQDLTYLFNLNQNKKTLARIDRLSSLQDGLVDQFSRRIENRPDEISNKELLDGMKIVQDIIERGQRQSNETSEQPLIQINQQTTNVDFGSSDLNRESRERVKNAVQELLKGLPQAVVPSREPELFEVDPNDTEEETDDS